MFNSMNDAFGDAQFPVVTIGDLADLSVEEKMEQFDVTLKQIAAVLDFVAQRLRGENRRGGPTHPNR